MAKRASKKDSARELAVAAARIAQDNNAEDIVVLDLRGISPVTDYFVIATGTSDRQMRSIADDVIRHGKTVGQKVWQVAGMESGDWIVLDFVDVVVHLFDQPHRRYYDLELIWGDARRVRWQRRSPATRRPDGRRTPRAGE
ncbi:MAG TPA: ribosome silencing factor [Phycisphaerales bacterium]|nr:ribosome silencing factor [Phycisphaerales bacterium]